MADENQSKGCCGETPLKMVLGLLTIVYLILGGLMITVGVFAGNGAEQFVDSSSDDILDSIHTLALASGLNDTADELNGKLKLDTSVLTFEFSIAFFVMGGVIALLAIEGFCGICGKESGALWVYTVCTGLVLLAQICIVLAFFAGGMSDMVKSRMTEALESEYKGFDEYKSTKNTFFTFMMMEFDCCGINDYTDFEGAKKWNNERIFDNGTQVTLLWPIACCKFTKNFTMLENVSCAQSEAPEYSNKDVGCWDELLDYIKGFQSRAVVAVAVTFVFELTLVVVGAVLLCVMRKQKPENDSDKPEAQKNRQRNAGDNRKQSFDNRVAPQPNRGGQPHGPPQDVW